MASSSTSITAPLSKLIIGKELLGHSPGDKRKVSIVKMTPVVNSKQMVFNALAQGTKLYSLTMSLYGIDFTNAKDAAHPITVSLGANQFMYCAPLKISTAKAQVRCSCPDFYFTWSYWDKQNKALAGPAMKPYVRKTQHYPERNPLHAPGCCKHLIGLTRRLIELKVLKD